MTILLMEQQAAAPLLVKRRRSGSSAAVATCSCSRLITYAAAAEAWEVFLVEAERLWVMAAPITFNILCLYGINSATQLFAGRLGNLELSAAAVGLSVVSTFSFGFLLGMASALETLCGQAYGAGHLHLLGVYAQRSVVILAASALLLSPLYLLAAPILRALGQDEAVAAAAGDFTLRTLPQLLSLPLAFPTQKLLQAQGEVGALAWIGAAALAAHVAMLALFVPVLGWGLRGAAAAYDVTSWVVALAQVAYVTRRCRGRGWDGLSWDALRGLWPFARLSLASAVMLCLEVWYMTVLVVLTGRLDDAEIAVGSVSIWYGIMRWRCSLSHQFDRRSLMDPFHAFWIPALQLERQRLGGDALHRSERGDQRARVQRAGVRPGSRRQARGGGGGGAVAGHGAGGHGAGAGVPQQLRGALHGRPGHAGGRGESGAPAGGHHGAQQRAAGDLRGGHRRRLAGAGGLHQPRLLLRPGFAARLLPGLPPPVGRSGDLGRHALRDCAADGYPAAPHLEDRLGSRGCAGQGTDQRVEWGMPPCRCRQAAAGGYRQRQRPQG